MGDQLQLGVNLLCTESTVIIDLADGCENATSSNFQVPASCSISKVFILTNVWKCSYCNVMALIFVLEFSEERFSIQVDNWTYCGSFQR